MTGTESDVEFPGAEEFIPRGARSLPVLAKAAGRNPADQTASGRGARVDRGPVTARPGLPRDQIAGPASSVATDPDRADGSPVGRAALGRSRAGLRRFRRGPSCWSRTV